MHEGDRPDESAPACAWELGADEERCPRCGSRLVWAKASWHCLDCRYKEGCCS